MLGLRVLLLLLLLASPAGAAIVITDQPGPSFQNTTCPTGTGGAAWTPPDGEVLIAWVITSKTTTPDTPTLAGNGLTWTSLGTRAYSSVAAPQRRLTGFRALVTGASLGAITLTLAATQSGCALLVQSVAGTLTTGANAADAIVQVAGGWSDASENRSACKDCSAGSLLALQPLTGRSNAVLAAVAIDGPGIPVAQPGWTLGTIQQYSNPQQSANTVWHTAPESLYPAVTWTGTSPNAAFAIELAIASPPASVTSITHGPFVGAMTSTAATVWVRADSAGEVTIKSGTDPSLAGATLTVISTGPSTDFTAKAPLTGLTAGTRYYYQAVGDVTSSGIHTFVTAPSAPTSLTLLFLTDFQGMGSPPSTPPGTAFVTADAEAPDLVFIGGDFDHSDVGTSVETTQRTDTRAMWKRLYDADPAHLPSSMPDFVASILRKYPTAHTWDDHDYDSNNSAKNATWRATVSRPTYSEYFPHYALPSVAAGIWQTFSWGTLVDFFILDSRSQADLDGTADPPGDPPPKSMLDGNAVGSPNGQRDWLKAQLLASTAAWKVIAIQRPWNHTAIKQVSPGVYDNWYAYQVEQTNLHTYIVANAITQVLLLSGDVHMGALENGASDPLNFPEVVGPPPNFVAGGGNECQNFSTVGTWSHGVWAPGAICNGYAVLRFTATTMTATVKDLTGATKLTMTLGGGSPPGRLLLGVGQ